MKVSIIIPNYNGSPFLNETILSVINQSISSWELIIVDDGSSDDSLSVIKKFENLDKRIRFFTRTQQKKGASSCRNIGIDNSTGEFLIFLDADDLLDSFCLEQRMKLLIQMPDLDFAVFNMGYFNKNIGDTLGIVNIYCNYLADCRSLFFSYQIPWQTTCPIWRREFLAKNNIRFSEKYYRLQDVEFHSKILINYNPIFHLAETAKIDCYYRQSPLQKSKPIEIESLYKLIFSISLYYKELFFFTKNSKYEKYLDLFVINIFHSLLFYNKLESLKPIINLYIDMNNVRPIYNISVFKIRLFGMLNLLRLTFVKGAGVSRLWGTLIK